MGDTEKHSVMLDPFQLNPPNSTNSANLIQNRKNTIVSLFQSVSDTIHINMAQKCLLKFEIKSGFVYFELNLAMVSSPSHSITFHFQHASYRLDNIIQNRPVLLEMV